MSYINTTGSNNVVMDRGQHGMTMANDRQVSDHTGNRSVILHTELALLFCVYLPQTGQG